MQIIELYIRSQFLAKGIASATTTNKLVDASAAFTTLIAVGDVVENITDNTTAKITAIDSATQVTLDNDIMASGEVYRIYSDYVKMDLFKDESVSISDSIQDVKDISKIFTTFSQQFNLPASQKNNKFFKQYQDTDVLNSFDARFKVDAIIKLNGVDFRKGKIRLNTVDLKDNKAYSYKVVFFGDIVELKDLMKDDDLSSLPFPDSLNFTYDDATILAKFQSPLDLDVAFPLITHSKYFNIHTNGRYQSGTDSLVYTDLKPALRIRKIIDAIELKYNLTFSNDFFNSFDFRKMYMLLHRAAGFVSNALTTGALLTVTNSFNSDLTLTSGNDMRPLGSVGGFFDFIYTITLSAATPVTVRITGSNGYLFAEQEFSSVGVNTLIFDTYWGALSEDMFFTVISENTLTIASQSLSVVYRGGVFADFSTTSAAYDFPSSSIQNSFIVSRQLPQMKVIDFMTSLFKMFNLTAYKENGIIVVRSLQDFYNAGNTYDITEYVDVNKSSVGKLLQFKQVDFRFKSKKYFLVIASDEIQDDDFGNINPVDTEFDGKPYKIEVDFEKMMYERLSDGGTLTNVTQGSLLDSNLEPTIGAPLLLYCRNTNADEAIFWNGTTEITNYKRPSNSNVGFSSSGNTLNFGGEMDENSLLYNPNSLFQNNYINYIASIFDKQARKTKVTAYLPLRILLKYQLNDTFIIGNKSYRINTIKTNLLTNKTELELFNLFTSSIDEQNRINRGLQRIADFATTSVGSTTIDTSWSAVSGVVRYWLYVDDVITEKQTATTYQFTGLESGVTYKLSGQVEYANNIYSQFQDIIVTTT
tara:strand:- start:271 stop:2709 length:2439 start_codon:yes stop_codon:yes gene_type:complete